jgi:hypothetical protein
MDGREIDVVRVKGKQRPVKVYEILGRQGWFGEHPVQQHNAQLHTQALVLFRADDFVAAQQLWQQVVGLKNEADLLVAYSGELRLGEVREFLSVQLDAAASGGVERAEDVEQRAFAGAGGANNREGIAALDNERDAAKHRHGIAVRTFVLFMNVLKLENDRVI